jgi:hypothetical protein
VKSLDSFLVLRRSTVQVRKFWSTTSCLPSKFTVNTDTDTRCFARDMRGGLRVGVSEGKRERAKIVSVFVQCTVALLVLNAAWVSFVESRRVEKES